MKIIELKEVIYQYLYKKREDTVKSQDDNGNKDIDKDKEFVSAIQDITMEIDRGEFVAILGANGSGKSTLARHLNALLIPTEGTVWIDGQDTRNEEVLLKIRQSVGMVFQNPDNQIVSSIVEEDVGFGPENLGIPTQEICCRVDAALQDVDMEQYRLYSPSHLSGGQKQRVAIAGVLAMKPACIVLDEATAMLDPLGRREVLEAVHKFNREEGITVILITHYMEETLDADRIFVMNQGKIAMEGTPEQIFVQEQRLKEYGLLVPQIIELANQLRREGIQLPSAILTMEDMVDAICQYA